MSKSVSNDALWEKLLEISEKLNSFSTEQKTQVLPDFNNAKDEIIREIKEKSGLLGKHSDVNFRAVNKNIELLNGNIKKILNITIRIREQQKENIEPQKVDNSYFNFKFFKVRKSSFVITILGLLVFILTLFCMKQQNDYTLLLSYKHGIVIEN